MSNRVLLSLLLVISVAHSYPAHAGWWEGWSFGRKCSERIIDSLHAVGKLPPISRRQLLDWRNKLPRRLGLSPEDVAAREKALTNHPELLDLMTGFRLPQDQPLVVTGGWAQDVLWAPTLNLWQAVDSNLEVLAARLQDKLHLHPLLTSQLFNADHMGIADSAWVLAQTAKGEEVKTASVKITYFDRTASPDGPWPRYSIESPLSSSSFLTFRRPASIPGEIADMAIEGSVFVRSSLDHWGLLPLETHTGFRIPEHSPLNYGPQYKDLFSDEFLLRHLIYMQQVLDAYGTRDVRKPLDFLWDLRDRTFPPGSLEVAEIQRFNIPPGASPASKAQLFYGLTVLLRQRPIRTAYIMAPRPDDPALADEKPEYEILFSQPGWEFLRRAAEEVIKKREMERRLNRPPQVVEAPATPKRDLLKEQYESLGFELIHVVPYTFGLPRGCNIMRAPVERLLSNLLAYQFAHTSHLTSEQLRYLQRVRKEIPDAAE